MLEWLDPVSDPDKYRIVTDYSGSDQAKMIRIHNTSWTYKPYKKFYIMSICWRIFFSLHLLDYHPNFLFININSTYVPYLSMQWFKQG